MADVLISNTTDSPFVGGNTERTGPFVCGTVLHAVQLTGTSDKVIHVYTSTDAGASWAEADAANAPQCWRSWNAFQNGSELIFVHYTGLDTIPSPVKLGYSIFDMLSGTWIKKYTTGPTVNYLSSGGGIGQATMGPMLRDNGALVLHYLNDQVDGDPPNLAFYTKGEIEIFQANSWIDPASGAYFSAFDPTFALNYKNLGAAKGTGGRSHMFISEDAVVNLHHRTFKSDNTLATLQTIAPYSGLSRVSAPIAWGVSQDKLAIAYTDASGNISVATATSADNPTWTLTAIGNTNAAQTTGNMNVQLVAYGCALFCVWNSATQYTYMRLWDGAGWSDGGASDLLVHDGGAANTKQKLSLGLLNSTTIGILFEKRNGSSATKNYSFASATLPSYTGTSCPGAAATTTHRAF
jgi:hypothetical protein